MAEGSDKCRVEGEAGDGLVENGSRPDTIEGIAEGGVRVRMLAAHMRMPKVFLIGNLMLAP